MIVALRIFTALLLTGSIVDAASFSPGRAVPVSMTPAEHISAAAVSDDGSGVLALTSAGNTSSRLLSFRPDGSVSASSVAGMRINRVTRISPSTLLVGGTAREAGYTFRLLKITSAGFELIWDSANLSIGKREHMVAASPDGRLWAAVQPSGRKLIVMIGSFPEYRPALTVEVAPDVDVAKQLRLDANYASLFFLNADASRPLVAVQWLGASFLIQPQSGSLSAVRQVLTTTHGPVTNAKWDAFSGLIWLKSRSTWSAFDLSKLEPNGARMTAEISADLVGSEPIDVISLASGRIAVTSLGKDGRHKMMIATLSPAMIVSSTVMPLYAHSVISGSGRTLLGLPDGNRSRMVFVHAIGL